jgi:Transposase and inactivated derivatives
MLIERRFGRKLSRWTVGRYMKEWGLTVQKPAKRALEQNPARVRYWLEVKYPAIAKRAKAEYAKIFWGDEMGLRSDHQAGTNWGVKGQTPVVRKTGNRFGCNMIFAITSKGQMAFTVFSGRVTGPVFLDFLERLMKHHAGSKIFLIVDRHSVHRSKAVLDWVQSHSDKIELFFLPAYSPELNPDEMLNNAAKSGVSRKAKAADKEELKKNFRSFLRSTQRRPKVQTFFKGRHVRYAQAA